MIGGLLTGLVVFVCGVSAGFVLLVALASFAPDLARKIGTFLDEALSRLDPDDKDAR